MAWTLDDILPAIVNAGNAGLPLGKIKAKLPKNLHGKIPETLKALAASREIRAPIKFGASQYYFGSGQGPSAETAAKVAVRHVLDSKTKLLSRPALIKKITGKDGKFAPEGIDLAVADKRIIQLTCGTSKYYLHRDVVQDYFALSGAKPAEPHHPPVKPTSGLSIQTVRPVFERLKAEQGGLGTIDIYDLMKALGVSKDALHPFLLSEVKAGHLTIHPTTTVQLKPEVIDAAIRLPGFAEPFVTVALKDDP